jgi:hypothetical protein
VARVWRGCGAGRFDGGPDAPPRHGSFGGGGGEAGFFISRSREIECEIPDFVIVLACHGGGARAELRGRRRA